MRNSRVDNPYRRGLPAHEDRAIRGCRRRPSRLLPCLLPAILLLMAAPVPAAGPNLFTIPEQRERLDRMRAEATAEERAREPEPETGTRSRPETPAARPPARLRTPQQGPVRGLGQQRQHAPGHRRWRRPLRR